MASLFIGLMSGTSLDGVDAVIVDFANGGPETLATAYLPYPETIKHDVLALHESGQDELHRSAMLAQQLAHLYADACRQVLAVAALPPGAIRAIGCHGQTVRHRPDSHYTLQLNDASRLAELTGIPVIADFRGRDMAAGGQGAPLVPAAHKAFFQSADKSRALLNLGGIANFTYLPSGDATQAVFGFDCGPANILMDAWSTAHRGISYDAEGAWARSGKVLPDLLRQLLAHPFFHQPPPKSCGREEFDLAWLKLHLIGTEAAEDVQRTLLELTCISCADALNRWLPSAYEIFLCGGGAHNALLKETLTAVLPTRHISTTTDLGISPDWVEAIAFAWLARQHVLALPGNLTSVTGARGPRILGAYYPA